MKLRNLLVISAFLLFSQISLFSIGVAIVNTNSYFNLVVSEVNVNVQNQIAVVTSHQSFINTLNEASRVKYAFPLPVGANPTSLRWKVNGVWKDATISDTSQDTTIPTGGGGTGGGGSGGGSQPSNELLDYLGTNALYFDIADFVQSGSIIEFEIVYVELLPYSFGEVTYRYPNNYSMIQEEVIESTKFNFALNSDRTIESIELKDLNANISNTGTASMLEYAGTNEVPDYNYEIKYTLKSDELGVYNMSTFLPDSLVQCDSDGRGFISLIIEPESNEDVEVIEKNFTLIIDQSGSMIGNKIIEARNAASFIVENLNQGDNFNIIRFSNDVESFRSSHVPYNSNNQVAALQFISDIEASGGTDINEALLMALDQFTFIDQGKADIIIFFTDGVATAGETQTQTILNNIAQEQNISETNVFLFTFGVGDDVDKALLTLLAQENSGLVTFLEEQNLEEEITSFFLKINNPVLINTSITFQPTDAISSIYPNPIPNLYKGQQLILSGRYSNPEDINITLTGNAFNLPVSYDFPISLADSNVVEQSFLPKIWAKQKIDALSLDYLISNSNSEQENIQNEIDNLSICYSVVSVAFTSFEDTALEVDMASFEVSLKDDENVLIEWSTAMELNNEYFIIERSEDGYEFEEIGKVLGAGTTSALTDYEYIDRHPILGTSYYRLKQIDINGYVSYSEVRVIVIEDEKRTVLIFPNPLPQGADLQISGNSSDPVLLEIFNTYGKMVYAQEVNPNGSVETPTLIQGNYLCNVSSKGKVFSFKLFVK